MPVNDKLPANLTQPVLAAQPETTQVITSTRQCPDMFLRPFQQLKLYDIHKQTSKLI